MEELLCDAAMRGDLESLNKIIAENECILDKVVVGSFKGKNPLHVALSTGQTSIVLRLLEIKPDLAEVLDAEQGAPLHVASAKGHVDIVEALVKAGPKMCLARDRGGNNPIHVAAMEGQTEVLEALVQTSRWRAQVKTDRGDTILHLCVKYNQFESLKRLLRMNPDPKFVNAADADGNTILHLAVFEKQVKMIKLVVKSCKRYVNAINDGGRTALDIHYKAGDQTTEHKQIQGILRHAGAKRRRDFVEPSQLEPSWQTKRRNTLMIVCSLIAAMAFQAGVNPPGGVWLENSAEHKVGQAIIAYTYPDSYPFFVYFNTMGFLLSLSTISLLIMSLPELRAGQMLARALISWCTIMTTGFSYTYSVIVISPEKMGDKSIHHAIKITAIVWAAVTSVMTFLVQRRLGSILMSVILNPRSCPFFLGELKNQLKATLVGRQNQVKAWKIFRKSFPNAVLSNELDV